MKKVTDELKQETYRDYVIVPMDPKRVAWILRWGGAVYDRVECDLGDDILEVARKRIDQIIKAGGPLRLEDLHKELLKREQEGENDA